MPIMRKIIFYLSIILLFSSSLIISGGKVYLVVGSDTAIWEGMNTGEFYCFYRPGLYTDPDRNAYAVMDDNFRNGIVDSYGTPIKFTWWMMCGSIRHKQ